MTDRTFEGIAPEQVTTQPTRSSPMPLSWIAASMRSELTDLVNRVAVGSPEALNAGRALLLVAELEKHL